MAQNLEDLETELLALPIEIRASLAQKLIQSLDQPRDPEHEELWRAELDRRYQAYKEGKVKGRPVEEVLRALRAKRK